MSGSLSGADVAGEQGHEHLPVGLPQPVTGPTRVRRLVWFKGGSEPGVLTLNYLATTRSGQSYMVSVLAENPTAPIAQNTAALTLLSAIKGAFELAAS